MSAIPTAGRKFQIRRKPDAPAASAAPSVFHNVQQLSRNVLTFQIRPAVVEYVNALRRAVLTEVETVGFRADIRQDGSTSDIKIEKNSTPMSNEMLSHRIGLLPIAVSNPLEWNPAEYQFRMSVTNDSADPRDVVAADIQVLKSRGPEEDPLPIPSTEFFHLDPISKETPLLAVLRGRVTNQEPERIEFEAKATLGTGRENARFIPVSQCSYKYTLDENPDRRKEFFEAWLQSHKKLTVTELDTNPTRKKELEREFETMEIARCFLVDERGEPYSFDMTLESVGVLDPYYIVARAIQVLQEKATRYASVDAGDLPETMSVRPADARMKGFDFKFEGEDHTLGTLLQTWMDLNLIDNGEITYVGYKVPHPLKDEMIVRVGVEDGKETTARAALAKAARGIADLFRNWGQQWNAVGGTAAAPPPVSMREALEMRRQARN